MFIYSITFAIEADTELRWVNFTKNNYIPKFQASGEVTQCRFTKILSNENPEPAYNIQFSFTNEQNWNIFLKNKGKTIHEEMVKTFSNKLAIFSTLLKEI